jgi:RNA polymerase sigma-70 factor (ECF subfamily)
MTNIVDRYLLFRLRTQQDPDAFARLYDRYVESIYRFAILKLSSKEEAEDVTSEVFTRTWQYIQERHDVVHFRALLYRIARNLIADRYRRAEPTVSLEGVTFGASGASTVYEGQNEPGDRGRTQALIEARADAALILDKLQRLKEDHRDVLTLRLIDGLPFPVIADILEKPVGTVRVIFHRALKALNNVDTA